MIFLDYVCIFPSQMMPMMFTYDMLMRERLLFLYVHKSHTNNEKKSCKFSDLMEFKFEKCKYFSGFSSLIRFCWENILSGWWWGYLKNNIEWNLHFEPQRDEWRKSIKNLFLFHFFLFISFSTHLRIAREINLNGDFASPSVVCLFFY